MIATLREVITYRFRSALSGGGFTGSTNHAFGSGWVTATARAGVLGGPPGMTPLRRRLSSRSATLILLRTSAHSVLGASSSHAYGVRSCGAVLLNRIIDSLGRWSSTHAQTSHSLRRQWVSFRPALFFTATAFRLPKTMRVRRQLSLLVVRARTEVWRLQVPSGVFAGSFDRDALRAVTSDRSSGASKRGCRGRTGNTPRLHPG